jgi:hypothetical protein
MNMGMGMGMGMNAGVPLQHRQTKPQDSSQQFMSDQDLNQLTGYMAGFN